MPDPRRLLRSLLTTPGPAVAVSIVPGQVTAVQLESTRSGPLVRGHARRPLPAGAVAPAVAGANLADAPAVAEGVDGVLDQLPRRPRRIALVLPDGAARVSVVRLRSVPARPADLDAMLRWQARRSVPFDVDEAQLDWTRGGLTADGEQAFVVVLAHRAVVEEYEGICTAAGVHAGRVDLAGFGLIEAALACGAADAGADWLLVHAGEGSSTLAVVRGRHPLLFRTVADGPPLGDLVHQTAMYYEDRIGGGGFSRALVAGGGAPARIDEVEQIVGDRLAITVERIAAKLLPLLPDRRGLDAAALDGLTAPLGLLLGQSAAAAGVRG